MKDDAQALLVCLHAGDLPSQAGLPQGRTEALLRYWHQLGWLVDGKLTARGRHVAGTLPPGTTRQPVVPPEKPKRRRGRGKLPLTIDEIEQALNEDTPLVEPSTATQGASDDPGAKPDDIPGQEGPAVEDRA